MASEASHHFIPSAARDLDVPSAAKDHIVPREASHHFIPSAARDLDVGSVRCLAMTTR
jgi:hypothetical protein